MRTCTCEPMAGFEIRDQDCPLSNAEHQAQRERETAPFDASAAIKHAVWAARLARQQALSGDNDYE